MNWVRQNRFLAGFLAVALAAAGGLSFLLFSAYGRYAQVNADYQTQVAELQRLQKLPVFPSQENLVRYEDLRKNYAASVNDLQTRLAALEPAPVSPPPTPLQFQDRLRQVVEESVRQAQTAGIELPKEYYLGFEQYRGAPPDAAATPLLANELNAVDELVGIILRAHAAALTEVKRGLLTQEGSTLAAAPAPSSAPGQRPAAPLVSRQTLELGFTALPSALREVLNSITTAKRLYLVRAVQVKNQVDKGPSRTGETPGGEPAPAPAPNPADPNAPALPANAPPPLRYVVGQEKLEVTMRVEIVRVQPSAAAPAR